MQHHYTKMSNAVDNIQPYTFHPARQNDIPCKQWGRRFYATKNSAYVIISNTDSSIEAWDVNSQTKILTHIRRDTLGYGKLSDDSAFWMLSYEKKLEIFSFAKGKLIYSLPFADCIYSEGISPDSTLLAVLNRERVLTVWDIRTGRQISETNLPKSTGHIYFDATSKFIITAIDARLELRDARNGEFIRGFAHEGCWDFSTNANYLLTKTRTSILWDIKTGEKIHETGEVTRLADDYLLTQRELTLEVWDIKARKEAYTVKDCADFKSAGDLLMIRSSSEIKVREISSGKIIGTITDDKRIVFAAFNSTLTFIFVINADNIMSVWDVHGKKFDYDFGEKINPSGMVLTDNRLFHNIDGVIQVWGLWRGH